MKKLITLCLSAVLLGGVSVSATEIPLPAALSQTPSTQSLDPELSQAYGKVVEQIILTYGEVTDMTLGNVQTGLVHSRLIDFDQDGVPELSLQYHSFADPNAMGSLMLTTVEEIWAFQNNTATKIYNNSEELYHGSNFGYWDVPYYLPYEGGYRLARVSGVAHMYNSFHRVDLFQLINGKMQQIEHMTVGFYMENGSWLCSWETADTTWQSGQWQTTQEEAPTLDAVWNAGANRHRYDALEPYSRYTDDGVLVVTDSCVEDLMNQGGANDYGGYPVVEENELYDTMEEFLGEEVFAIFALDGWELYYVVILVDGIQESCIVGYRLENGVYTLYIYHQEEENLSEEGLNTAIAKLYNESNIKMDYNQLSHLTTAEEFSKYLETVLVNIEGWTLNASARREVEQYIQRVLSQAGSIYGYAEDNRIFVHEDDLIEGVERLEEMKSALEEVLQGVEFFHDESTSWNWEIPMELTIRVHVQGMDVTKPMDLILESGLWRVISEEMNLSLQIQGYDVTLGGDVLAETRDTIHLILEEEREGVSLLFVSGEGEPLTRFDGEISLSIPASSFLDTVYLQYDFGQDNWGGYWDSANQTLTVKTSFSGQYQVLEPDYTMTDVDYLSEEMQDAIGFMVSKGYFFLYDQEFYPTNPLSRYAFAQALVGMFFALDRNLSTTFTDVPLDSAFYPFVASAQSRSLVGGFSDTQFGGESNLTYEQLSVIMARTLTDGKGYTLLGEPEDYLRGLEVSEWAKESLALCYQEGIFQWGEMIKPSSALSRGGASLYLYRMFQCLYQENPVTTQLPELVIEQIDDTLEDKITMAVFAGWTVILGIIWSMIAGSAKKKRKSLGGAQ